MYDVDDEMWYRSITERGTQKDFKAGEVIALQDEPSDYVGYIISGQARAIAYSEQGEATWVGYFSPDTFFGHTALITDIPANFEICADTDMQVVIITVKAMQSLLLEDAKLSRVLTKDLAMRLDMMTRRLVESLTLTAKGRVCAELARLSNIIGIMPEKQIIRPAPVFVELGMRVNLTRETVSRTISELQKKGIVSRQVGALVIENPQQLKAAIR